MIFPGAWTDAVKALATTRGHAVTVVKDVDAGFDELAVSLFDVVVLQIGSALDQALALCRRLRATVLGGRVALLAAVGPDAGTDAGTVAALLDAGAAAVAGADERSLGVQLDVAVWRARQNGAGRTDRASLERSLHERAARAVSRIDSSYFGIVFWDARGDILDANDAFLRMVGYSREELATRALRWTDLTPEEYRAVDDLALAELARHGICAPVERDILHKDGRRVPIVVAPALVEGARDHGVCLVIDMSARRAAEEALRASEERLRLVVRATSDAFWDWDIASCRVLRSEGIKRFYGFSGVDVGEEPAFWLDRLHPDDREHVVAALRRAVQGEVDTVEMTYRCARIDGSYANVIDRAIVVRDVHGKPCRMIGAIRDVTERRQVEGRLLLADRMTSLGTLAAGIAHEINNPLAYTIANVDYARRALRERGAAAPLEPLLAALDEAAEGGARVREIVGGLKTFSRADDGALGPVEVARVVHVVLRMAHNQIRSRARLEVDLASVPRVHANEARLGQVILNLLVNAAQALPEGAAAEHEVRLATAFEAPDRVRIEVSDTGPGVPEEIRGRIFDPFFTTKPIGEGTGLGLAICHGIVTGFGGEIRVESEPGRGARFCVLLPIWSATDDVVAPPAEAEPVASRRVLVVDDEPLILKAIARTLEPEHEVVALASAREALSRFERGERFDVILCDLMMPEMTGADFHEALARSAPGQVERLVFLTGGAFSSWSKQFLDRVPNRRLEKPFSAHALRALVAEVAGGAA